MISTNKHMSSHFKKNAVIFVMIIISMISFTPSSNKNYQLMTERNTYYEKIHDMSIDDLIRLNYQYNSALTIDFTDDTKEQIRSIKGRFFKGTIKSEFDCLNALYGIRTLLGISDKKNILEFTDADEWTLKKFLKVYKLNDDYYTADISNINGKRFFYRQYYNGIEVADSYVVIFSSYDGLVTYVSSNLENINSGNISGMPIIGEENCNIVL